MTAIEQMSLFDRPASPVPTALGHVRVTESDSMHLLSKGVGSTKSFDYTLNPYRGCSFGCSYCFAASFVPDQYQKDRWGSWVEVKVRALHALRKADLRDKRIFMSSATDPYQPVERQVRLTRSIVKHLLESQARLVVQTRSPYVADDIELLKGFRNLRVNMSITTDSDEVRKRFEPGCASIDRRLQAVAALKAAGLRVAVCVCPMLPMNDPASFGRRLDELGADAVAACWFHQSNRPFASTTRDLAWALNRESGWTYTEFETARQILRRNCRALAYAERGFQPE